MKTRWQVLPFVRCVIAFIGGILFTYAYDPLIACISLLSFFVIYLLVCKLKDAPSIGGQLNSVLLLSFFFVFGILRFELNDERIYPSHFSHFEDESSWEGIVKTFPKIRSKTSVQVSVQSVCKKNKCFTSNGNLLVYFPREDSISKSLKPGDKLAFNGVIKPLQPTRNPKAFDYPLFLSFHNIHYQLNIKDFKILSSGHLNPIAHFAQNARVSLLNILGDGIEEETKNSLLSAMVLGYRNDLSRDLYDKFSNSGSIHILAVSGLHIGVVLAIIFYLIRKWKPAEIRTKILKTALPILIACFYAILTGAAPAVVRAGYMFSLWYIGKEWFRYYNHYNILAFTGLTLLMYNPYLLFQASFIFSYTSLLSILIFQPHISKVFKFENVILIKVADLTSLSLAAQILIFPLSLLIFHKFPVYFILSGILIVPIGMMILILGLSYISLFWMPLIGELVLEILNRILDLLLILTDFIEELPYSVIEGIWITPYEVCLMYSIIIGGWFFLKRGAYRYLVVLGSSVFLLVLSIGLKSLSQNTQKEIIVYDSYKGSIVDIISGHNCWTYNESNLSDSEQSYIAVNYRNYKGVWKKFPLMRASFDDGEIKVKENVFQIGGKTFSLITGLDSSFDPSSDYLIISNWTDWEPNEIELTNTNVKVITDSTISKNVELKWSAYCRSNNLVHLSSKDGAVIIKL